MPLAPTQQQPAGHQTVPCSRCSQVANRARRGRQAPLLTGLLAARLGMRPAAVYGVPSVERRRSNRVPPPTPRGRPDDAGHGGHGGRRAWPSRAADDHSPPRSQAMLLAVALSRRAPALDERHYDHPARCQRPHSGAAPVGRDPGDPIGDQHEAGTPTRVMRIRSPLPTLSTARFSSARGCSLSGGSG